MEYKIGQKKSFSLLFKELWVRRELFWIFAWRDLKLKYRQTVIGFAWVVLQPLLMMLIFTAVFASRIDTSDSEIPYYIFVFTGLIIYNAFSGGVSNGSNSLVLHGSIIKKNYFPRIILPFSSVFISFVDFLASLSILLVMMIFSPEHLHLFHFMGYSLLAFFLAAIPSVGFSVFFSGLNVRYRDVNFIYPFFLQIMLFVSPIIYPIQTVDDPVLLMLLKLNPISGAIELQKAAVQISYIPDMEIIWMSLGSALVVCFLGFFTFNKLEKSFADVI